MSGKFINVNIHMVWSTKWRKPLLDSQWSPRLYGYLGGIAHSNKARLLEAGGQADHVHLYVSMPSTLSIAQMVNTLKANSSRWIRESFPNRKLFAWQEGYGAFSVSKSGERAIIEYIINQAEHHKRIGFREEFLKLLKEHEIDFDSKYIFD
jgi:putative transposase